MQRRPRSLKPEQLEQQIVKLLSKNPRTRYNLHQIFRKINIGNPKEEVINILSKLQSKGKIVKFAGDRYKWETMAAEFAEKVKKSRKEETILYSGIVDMTRSGAAYIINTESVVDIYVHAKNLKGALHKDEVTVAVPISKKSRRPEGIVVSIDKRDLKRIVGHIDMFDNYAIVRPENDKIYPDVYVHFDESLETNQGDRVIAEITDYGKTGSKRVWGKVLKLLENLSHHEMTMQSILFSNGFDPAFPEDAEAEVAAVDGKVTTDEILKRRDFRTITTFTIDPATAKDFDDAISIQFLENETIEVGVHIADVTHFLYEGSALDQEAGARTTSVYLVDRVCPMLPERLSNDLCSLNPHEDKFTFSAVFTFDKEFDVIGEWYGKTIIHSDRRFTYEEAQENMETQTGDFFTELTILNKIAYKLREERFDQGAISFESEELQFILDENNMPIGMYVKERKDAHKLIEEFMLLANRYVATFIAKKAKPKIPFVYRIHDLPNPEKLEDFARFAGELGFQFKTDTPDHIATSFNRLAEESQINSSLKLLEPLAIRTMSKAEYSTENIGHYGLGFEYYCHFTSPIRRYADVLVHRILFQNLKSIHREDQQKLEAKCKHISEMEKRANDAERESVKYMQTIYISQFIGKTFEGIISGIIEKGIFVELVENKVEGLILFDSMGGGFEMSKSRLKAKNRYSGDVLTIGQGIWVKVISADPDTKRTDFQWIDSKERSN